MSFLKRAIQDGIRKGIGDAIGKAVQQAVEPAATRFANQAAESIDQIAGQTQKASRPASGLEGALGNLQRSLENYATEASRSIKVCPGCGAPAAADQSFCQQCGEKLPETTLAQFSLCPACGRQNTVGTRYCSDCGAKLPLAAREEAEAAARSAEVMARWDTLLANYPKWNCGGIPVDIEPLDGGEYIFTVDFRGDVPAARQAVKNYLALARQKGFRPAGMYPSEENLYSRVNGTCYYFDTEHAFDGDTDCPCIAFAIREPEGGFDYVKPERKKPASFFDLLK